ncbi:MAG TPA: DUF1800 domain-containing protein [Fimbriimonadaceae bacterium]|jgi:uncharacterized protein (DUF1800 family)
MNATRRELLKIGVLAGAASTLGGCGFLSAKVAQKERGSAQPLPQEIPPEEDRMLNRLGFGPNSADLASYRQLGSTAFIDQQLKGDQPEDAALTLQLARLDVLQLEPSDLWDLPFERVLFQLQQAAILQAAYGRNQLRERMVDFWSNHFNIYGRKGNTGYAKGVEESQIIRANALGDFPTMLKAMAHSPAMLEYLDNQRNVRGVPNENYARELMELHTLGLHGGYTQKDVQEVARCFTGWTIETRFLRPKGHFRFDPDLHDYGPKTVLGHEIAAGGGEQDAMLVLDILSSHPSTARFISTKLCSYFMGEPDPDLADKMFVDYLSSSGDIKAILRPLLVSGELQTDKPILKRPFDFMVSALRYTNADTDGGKAIQDHLDKMGEPLYQWPMPDGYPTKASSWTSSLLPRWNFAAALSEGKVGGTSIPDKAQGPRTKSFSAVSAPLEDKNLLAVQLASPEFQWR